MSVKKNSIDTSIQPKVPEKAFIRSEQEMLHHVYKLMPADMKKNSSYDDKNPIWEKIAHCHIFHNIDSSGKIQDKSQPTGGHFHTVEIVETDGQVPMIKVSSAMKLVRETIGRKKKTFAVPIEEDNHTHDWQYLRSELIKMRQINPEAAKVVAHFAPPPSLAGVEIK